MSAREKMVEQCEADDWLRKLVLRCQIFDKASEGLLYYPVKVDRVSMVNEACTGMHGYSREEVWRCRQP